MCLIIITINIYFMFTLCQALFHVRYTHTHTRISIMQIELLCPFCKWGIDKFGAWTKITQLLELGFESRQSDFRVCKFPCTVFLDTKLQWEKSNWVFLSMISVDVWASYPQNLKPHHQLRAMCLYCCQGICKMGNYLSVLNLQIPKGRRKEEGSSSELIIWKVQHC